MVEAVNGTQSNSATVVTSKAAEEKAALKLTFAGIAAMAPKNAEQQTATPKAEAKATTPSTSRAALAKIEAPAVNSRQSSVDASRALAALRLQEGASAGTEPRHREPTRPLPIEARLEDDKTHLSISSTKAPSLDGGKSVASGTTFALDEKESIRPDDSASVQAVEDDDSSGPGSGEPGSRFGSDTGIKPFHYQFHEVSERAGINGTNRPLPLARRVVANTAEEARRLSAQNPVAGPTAAIIADGMVSVEAVPPMPAIINRPDEKLLEAMESPKDRSFLLKLEQQFIQFIKDPKSGVLDLPPCNSFCRLLAHRLGDYYQLSHFVDNSVSAVRLHKNTNTHLPKSLGEIFQASLDPEDHAIAQRSMKIMRRVESTNESRTSQSGENTTASSVAPSGPTSDAGDDESKASGVASPTEATSAKGKASKSREEREAKYKEVRERIFGDFKEAEGADSGQNQEGSHGVSRASSVTGGKKKKKAGKKATNDDDGFQARSAYNLFLPGAVRPGPVFSQPTRGMTYYSPQVPNGNPQMMQPGYYMSYNEQFEAGTTPQMQSYQVPIQTPNSMPTSGGFYPQTQQQPQQFVPFNQHQQQMTGQFYPLMQQPTQMPPQASGMSPVMGSAGVQRPQSQMSDQSWVQSGYAQQFQGFSGMQSQYPAQTQTGMPNTQMGTVPASYAYGQFQFPPGSPPTRAPHPVPGSFTRQNLNPQTRAFVPGGGQTNVAGPQQSSFYPQMVPVQPQPMQPQQMMQQPMQQQIMSPQQQQPHPMQQSMTQQHQQPMQQNPSYMPPGSFAVAPPTQKTPSAKRGSHRANHNKGGGGGGNDRNVSTSTATTSPYQNSSLSKWTAPATLPAKPPPPVPSTPGSATSPLANPGPVAAVNASS